MSRYTFYEGWYLLYTNSKQEKKVAEQLLVRNVRHYLPLVKEVRKWSDRVKVLDRPLFPSYIFIYLEQFQDYYQSLSVKGVLNYVKFENEIARVSDSIVNNLKIVVTKGENIEISDTVFQKGETLIIGTGPLIGLHCEVVEYNSKKMILVRIDLLKRNVLIELPVTHLYRDLFPVRHEVR